jgi:hypothetical protein
MSILKMAKAADSHLRELGRKEKQDLILDFGMQGTYNFLYLSML